MTRKYLRKIVVDNGIYCWMVMDRPLHRGAELFERVLTLRNDQFPQSACRFVAACIRYALANGWTPTQSRSDMRFVLDDLIRSQLLDDGVVDNANRASH